MRLQLGICLFSAVVAQWGGFNNYGYGPPPNNNNLGIGYPTAYGLWLGRGGYNNGGWDGQSGHPSQGTGFGSPLRCLNGGAHIGQCRLDKDSICIALGGTCIHGACCTTPFIGLGTSTTPAPAIDGEVTVRRTTSPRTTPATVQPISESEESEVNELRGIIEMARSSTTTETTPYTEVTQVSEVEESKASSDEKKYSRIQQCLSGLKAVGPCGDDSDCPTLHHCERNMCCYTV